MMGGAIETYMTGIGAAPFRQAAAARFLASGFPSRKAEAWRYTPLGRLTARPYLPAAPGMAAGDFLDLPGMKALFVNGRQESGIDGIIASTLSMGLDMNLDGRGAEAFSKSVSGTDEGLLALNAAMCSDGLMLDVPIGERLWDVVQLCHRAVDCGNGASHLRNIVTLGAGAEATLVEIYRGDGTASWTNAFTDIVLDKDAVLHHVILIQGLEPNTVTHHARARAASGAVYRPFLLQAGSGVMRAEVRVALEGRDARLSLGGLQLAGKDGSLDLYTHVRHGVPSTVSSQIVRNIADAGGVTSYQGSVHVDRAARLTDAQQSCKSLLLAETAEANVKPELEIYADEVKCAHGAAVGALDPMQLFYLMSRGLDEAAARALLIEAFAEAALEEIESDAVRAAISARAKETALAMLEGLGS